MSNQGNVCTKANQSVAVFPAHSARGSLTAPAHTRSVRLADPGYQATIGIGSLSPRSQRATKHLDILNLKHYSFIWPRQPPDIKYYKGTSVGMSCDQISRLVHCIEIL
ncbi:hypothetical protein JZ751_009983 [Albula glossodonta]|uniref:Uncharacterized protein n=1 Tax=Albula glossodonta TaxID=121402 RepID=A0A8T2MSG8_9TELE|nr:hypothetical protein JZ751_009983 [Albula glossodonta]